MTLTFVFFLGKQGHFHPASYHKFNNWQASDDTTDVCQKCISVKTDYFIYTF